MTMVHVIIQEIINQCFTSETDNCLSLMDTQLIHDNQINWKINIMSSLQFSRLLRLLNSLVGNPTDFLLSHSLLYCLLVNASTLFLSHLLQWSNIFNYPTSATPLIYILVMIIT